MLFVVHVRSSHFVRSRLRSMTLLRDPGLAASPRLRHKPQQESSGGLLSTRMSFDPVFALAFNAGAQVLVSSLLGTFMLIPLQP